MSRIAVCLSLACLALGANAQGTSERGLPHASPCPDVYSYGWEPARGWHGIITILPPARFSEVQLVLRMTVPYYRPEAGVGRVEVKGGTPEIQAISRRAFRGERHKIQFMIVFPPFDDVPRVKEIFFNGKSFCAAGQVYADTRSTIELKYTLRSGLNLPLANGNEFSVVSSAAPSRPDLVTVAILQPTDEARPMVSSPQSPPRPGPPEPPCKCNRTEDSADEEDVPMPHRPENHVFHSFKPPAPSAVGEDVEDQDSVTRPRPGGGGNNFATPPPASGNRPTNGNNFAPPPPASGNRPANGNNFAPPPSTIANRPTNSNKPTRPGFGGNDFPPPPPGSANRPTNGNNFAPPSSASANRPTNGNKPTRPGFGGNDFAPPSPASGNRPANGNDFAPPPPPPPNGASSKNEEVDDKIYFIMTDSDEVNSPRIIKLLEHLLVISKKHYQVDLERLHIEKKRLSLEKYPHYTFVV